LKFHQRTGLTTLTTGTLGRYIKGLLITIIVK